MGNYQPFGSGASGDESGDSGIESANASFLNLGGGSNSGDDSGGNDRDSNGDLWDGDIHTEKRTKNADGTWRKKRGRKASSASSGNRYGRGSTQKSNKANIESLASILAIVHAGLASATKTPEIVLDGDDADALAKAATNVLVEFDVTPNPKVQAVVGLVMTCGAVYGPKAYLIKERLKEEKSNGKRSD